MVNPRTSPNLPEPGPSFASVFPMSFARQRLGERGESLACAELSRLGYAVLARRYRTRAGELDIIARDAGTVVFVEVKTRVDQHFGDPAEAVTVEKQRRVVAMAADYVARHRLENTPCRFDVVTVDAFVEPPRITVYKDAFRPGW
jgi:putative endonuclease